MSGTMRRASVSTTHITCTSPDDSGSPLSRPTNTSSQPPSCARSRSSTSPSDTVETIQTRNLREGDPVLPGGGRDLMTQRILVTGGCGFIGSNFLHHWITEHPGDSIVNFDALTYAGNPKNVAALEGKQQYSFIQGDITDPKAVEKAMADIDMVVHFAAESHVDRSIEGPRVFLRTNVEGTGVLLDA